MEKKIREVWFKDHKANYIKINDDLKILEWKKTDSLYMNVRYVMDCNKLYITGDLYSAIFTLTEISSLEIFKDYNSYYFNSKLTTMEQDTTEFNYLKAKDELKEYLEEFGLEGKELETKLNDSVFSRLLNSAKYINRQKSWNELLHEYSDELSEEYDCWWDWVPNLGIEPSSYLTAYLIGLKMAYEQIFGEK